MKYVSIPEVITAELYRPGLEDGFKCYAAFCPWDAASNCRNQCKDAEAYIRTHLCSLKVRPGDFILTHADNSRTVISPEEFHKKYKCVQS